MHVLQGRLHPPQREISLGYDFPCADVPEQYDQERIVEASSYQPLPALC